MSRDVDREPARTFGADGRLSDDFVRWLAAGHEPSSGWFAYLRLLAMETAERRGLMKPEVPR